MSTTEVPTSTDGDPTTEIGSVSTSLDDSGTESDTTGSVGPTTDTVGPTTDSTTDSTTFDEDTSGFVSFVGFIEPPDMGVAAECSVWDQDCPDDEKCNAWANDGGNSWNAWKCVPIDPGPGAIGDPCMVEGSGTSGIDDCDLGTMCFYVDSETNQGSCTGYCQGTPDSPTCEDPMSACIITNDGWLPLCLPTCDPFVQDCGVDQGCYAIDGTFTCVPDASGAAGVYFDPCEFINVCDPGLHCASVDNLPGCAASGCCTPWCDLDGFLCPDDLDCVPYFEFGMAPAGYEDVGFCGVPT